MLSKKVLFIIIFVCLALALVVGVSIYLIYNSKKDNFYNVTLPLASVSGRYVKINAQPGQVINIAGVFIYDQNGNNLITDQTYAMANVLMNSAYTPANKALDIIFATDSNGTNNVDRNINDSPLIFENYKYLLTSGSEFTLSQNWQGMDANIAHSNRGGNPLDLDYWQYDFGSDIDISAVEIYTRTDCCFEQNINLTVQVINSNGNISLLNTPAEFAPVIISTVVSNQIADAASTTMDAASTTADAASTTADAASTTIDAASTTIDAASTTADAASTTIDMPILNMPSMQQIPVATPGMITNLLNNGIGIDYITSQGMGLNSAYRGPSTNIVQTNFSGTSNVYSPFLYYNKGSSEKFIGKLYHPYP